MQAEPHGFRFRALSERCIRLAAYVVAAIVFANVGHAAAQSATPRRAAADASVGSLERISPFKLDGRTLSRLRDGMTGGRTQRVIVGLAAGDEPFAALRGHQVRGQAARRARSNAIDRLQRRVMSRVGTGRIRVAGRFRHVPYMALELDAEQLGRLARLPEVISIQVDELMRPSLHDTIPQIGADLSWLQGYSGNGKTVAVLDTGIDNTHPAFAGRIVSEACYSTTSIPDQSVTLCPAGALPGGEDYQIGTGAAANCTDMLGCDHGNHVAGIAAGSDSTYSGVAPDANLIAIQVFSRLNDFLACGLFPPCLSSFTSDVIRGLERVYELRDTYDIAAVNMSLGGEAYASAAACDAAYPALKSIIDDLRAEGVTTVVASGNEYHTDAIATPACISSAVSVGAVDVIDVVADFSNSASFLETLAPGVGIVSALPGGGFGAKTGTSMAAPVMSGAVAVLASAAPDATPDELVDAIKSSGVAITDWRNGITLPRVQVDAAADLLTADDLDRIVLGLEPYAAGFDQPVGVTNADDGSGRLFVLERTGRVRIHDGTAIVSTPFVDLSAQVACCAGEGLLGLAFHPGYTSNGHVFVSYLNAFNEVVVERHTVSADPNQVDAGSDVEILRVSVPAGGHHGGRLAFGPDGYLYVALGDGAADGTVTSTAADTGVMLGKMLRLNVDGALPYTIPPGNPYVGVAGAEEAIWALGLRDPRHFSFDPLSGELYVADVGENAAHEVNVQSASSLGGEDYGWSEMEGAACRPGVSCDPAGFSLPATEYDFGAGCAITGGVVYRGSAHAELYGAYVYGDLCSGRVWGLRNQGSSWDGAEITDTPFGINAFGRDEAGEVYLVDAATGELHRLVASDLEITTTRLSTGFTDTPYSDTLAASGGSAPYQWSIVEGSLPSGFTLDAASGVLSGSTAVPGGHVLTVQVMDGAYATVTRVVRLTITPPPLVVEPATLADATVAKSYSEAVTASGGLPPYTFDVSAGALPAGLLLGADGTLAGIPSEAGDFSFTVRVTDDLGTQSTRVMSLHVQGPEIALTLNMTDSGEYGKGYGSDQHKLRLVATFTGTTSDLRLLLTGWDIDNATEVEVRLNDAPFGFLSQGPNNGLNAGDSFDIPATLQLAGEENRIEFVQGTPGFTWGLKDLLLTDVPPPPTITTASLPDAVYLQAYAAQLTSDGGVAPLGFDVSAGALPPGLTLAADGSLSGAPEAMGSFAFTVRVTDGLGSTAEQPLVLTVTSESGDVELILAPGVTDSGQYGHKFGTNQHKLGLYANFTGTAGELTVHVTGYDIDFVDEIEVLLNDVRIGYLSKGPNNGFNAGDIFVIPAGAQLSGQNRIYFKQRTSGYKWGVKDLLLSAAALPPAVVTTTLPDAVQDAAYSESLAASGGSTPYSWTVSDGALPPGLDLAGDGALSGIPSVQGVFAFTVQVTDDAGATAEQPLALTVTGASGGIDVTLTVGVMDPGEYGNGFGSDVHETEMRAVFTGTSSDLTLTVTGYDIDYADELSVWLNGVLIDYLTTGPNNGLNGGDSFIIPAASQMTGENELLFKVKRVGWIWGVKNLLLSDTPIPPAIVTTTLPDANEGESYLTTLQGVGGSAPYTWTISAGALPAGVTLDTNGNLSGTPSASGSFNFTARLTDGAGAMVEQPLTLSVVGVSGAVEVTLSLNAQDPGQYGNGYGTDSHPTALRAHFAGTTSDLTLSLTGFDIDYVDELSVRLNGALLGYLTKGPNNGLNAGDSFIIPAISQLAGDNVIDFEVKTAGWIWGVTNLLLSDVPIPPSITTTALTDATQDAGYLHTLSVAGGRAPFTWEVVLGALPSGISLLTDGTLSGVPDTQGSYDFTVRVTDDDGVSDEQALNMLVTSASGTVEVTLEMGVMDSGQYGHLYGSDVHRRELFVNFTGTAQPLNLSVTGFDIDYVNELSVTLNGELLGYLSTGPNNGYNAGDTFVIPAESQLIGNNVLRFRVQTDGWKWGVTDLLLTP